MIMLHEYQGVSALWWCSLAELLSYNTSTSGCVLQGGHVSSNNFCCSGDINETGNRDREMDVEDIELDVVVFTMFKNVV